jgi:hypothetical protein
MARKRDKEFIQLIFFRINDATEGEHLTECCAHTDEMHLSNFNNSRILKKWLR